MSGKGVACMPIDEEADLGYRRKVSVQGSDDGEQCKGFRLNTRWVRLGKGRAEIDDCHLIGVAGPSSLACGHGHEEDFVDVRPRCPGRQSHSMLPTPAMGCVDFGSWKASSKVSRKTRARALSS